MSNKRGFDRTGKRKATLYRFRAFVRTVIINRKWLIDVEEQKLSLNYKKNIAMLVRTQKKIGILTLEEKAIIRKVHAFRTIEERKKLVTLLAGLNCFANIPPVSRKFKVLQYCAASTFRSFYSFSQGYAQLIPSSKTCKNMVDIRDYKLRARLVSVIKFINLDRGQVIIREGVVPLTIYFILCGEVEVSKKVYCPVLKKYKNVVEYISGPGDCIGDIDFYENRQYRQNNYTATQATEVLVVYDDDFDLILRPYMSQQWENRKKALKALEYFNFFDEEQIQTACRLGVVRLFEPLENIYFEDKGAVSYVHFVLCGECMILQRLRVKVKERKGEKIYKLITIVPDSNSNKEFGGKLTVEVMNQLKRSTESGIGSDFTVASEKLIKELDQEDNNIRRQRAQEELAKVEALCRKPGKLNKFLKKSKSAYSTKSDKSYRSVKSEGLRRGKKLKSEKVLKVQELNEDNADQASIKTAVTNVSLAEENAEEEASVKAAKSQPSLVLNKSNAEEASLNISSSFKSLPVSLYTGEETINEEEIEQKQNTEFENFEEEQEEIAKEQEEEDSLSTSSLSSSSSYSSTSSSSAFKSFRSENHRRKSKQGAQRSRMENHFIDVGSLFYHGVFGLGEELIDRNIMARTAVQCLLLPRFWLFEKDQNPANAWGRRRFYLDSNIPSRLQLFENFLKTREWQAFKSDFVESHIKDFIGNPTKKEDIPIIGHIVDNE